MRLSLALSLLTSSAAFMAPPAAFVMNQRNIAIAIATPISAPNTAPNTVNTALFGILDEMDSDAYDLSGSEPEGNQIDMNNAYEMFLANLVFSTNDPRVDIINDFERATDDVWLEWLDQKVETCRDAEERMALRDLYDMICDIKKTVELSQMAEDRLAKEAAEKDLIRIAAAELAAKEGRKMTNADVLMAASGIDAATGLDSDTLEERSKTFYEQELTPEIRMSYGKMLKDVLPPYGGGETATTVITKYYDQFDAQFVKVLNEKATTDPDALALVAALAQEQQKRIGIATDKLKVVLAMGDPQRMEGAIIKMAREGKVDEPFLLLLEANATQARDANALMAAELMDKLRGRALEEKDKQASSKEIRLIRQLLRANESIDREKMLEDAFTPRELLLVSIVIIVLLCACFIGLSISYSLFPSPQYTILSIYLSISILQVAGTQENARKAVDGEAPEEAKPLPDVSPPDFINACKAVLLNFGNLGTDDDRGDLATRIKTIASEAEVVATRIYGKGMSVREQQDRAWKEQTTSIFDLETMEIEAERMGESAPWSNPDAPDDVMPGFDANGKMQIGGV